MSRRTIYITAVAQIYEATGQKPVWYLRRGAPFQPVPLERISGEPSSGIHVLPSQIARNHVHRPDLVAAAIITVPEQNRPFVPHRELACLDTGGELNFIDRIHNRVKIVGMRLEPSEVPLL